MGIIAFFALGLAAGGLAKAVPRTAAGGWIATLFLGVIGAIAAGFLASLLLGVDLSSFFDPRTWALAATGSVAVLVAFGLLTGGRN